uniref:hypothetical protein n=1 Tax=Ezakiella massiliensis TaxID=1852374 RepID=UPI00094E5A23|nr:hypothetical protein [Ezakiella massiliensis]
MDARLDLNGIDLFYTKFNERRYITIDKFYIYLGKTIEIIAPVIVKFILEKIFDNRKNNKSSEIKNQAYVNPWFIIDYDKSDVIVKKNFVCKILVMNIALKNNELNPGTNIKSISFGYNFQEDYYTIEIRIKKQVDCGIYL